MGAVSDTRQRILATARALFTERGLHRVGVRDIARALELSPGNLAYHFPTKDDLVSALASELHELNARTVFARLPDDFSVVTLYETAILAMKNMLEYRFLLLSYADVVTASPELQQVEAALAQKRRSRENDVIERLIRGGLLDRKSYAPRAERLHEQGQILSTGWLTAAMLGPGPRDDRSVVLHHAKLGIALLEPHLTAKGAIQLRQILAGQHDAIGDRLWPRRKRAQGS
jgi:AcrR family transcriptional regulator